MWAHLLPSGRRVLVLDVLAIAWTVAWIVLAVRVVDEVHGLRALSVTAESTGRAEQQVGAALGSIDVPFVGDRIDAAADAVTEAGRQTVQSARRTRESVNDLQVLLGLAVGLLPISPLLLVYLPLRIAHLRERRALRTLLRRAQSDPALEQLLARRALETMSYQRLRDLPGRPWVAAEEADAQHRLIDMEAERVGARRR